MKQIPNKEIYNWILEKQTEVEGTLDKYNSSAAAKRDMIIKYNTSLELLFKLTKFTEEYEVKDEDEDIKELVNDHIKLLRKYNKVYSELISSEQSMTVMRRKIKKLPFGNWLWKRLKIKM